MRALLTPDVFTGWGSEGVKVLAVPQLVLLYQIEKQRSKSKSTYLHTVASIRGRLTAMLFVRGLLSSFAQHHAS